MSSLVKIIFAMASWRMWTNLSSAKLTDLAASFDILLMHIRPWANFCPGLIHNIFRCPEVFSSSAHICLFQMWSFEYSRDALGNFNSRGQSAECGMSRNPCRVLMAQILIVTPFNRTADDVKYAAATCPHSSPNLSPTT
jgi:hypothetical protein